MKYYSIIILVIIILACGVSKNEEGYNIPNLNQNIKSFIDARKCFEKKTDVLVVNLTVKNDTLAVEIADTYQKVNVKFNDDTVLYGHRIIFTGESINGYSRKASTNQYPPDIVEASKSRQWPYLEEFTIWRFLYKDNKLIHKDLSCSEFD